MCKKCAKMANFKTSCLNYWETVEDRWIYKRCVLQALNPLSNRVTFTAIVPEASRTGALNARWYEKVAISDQYLKYSS